MPQRHHAMSAGDDAMPGDADAVLDRIQYAVSGSGNAMSNRLYAMPIGRHLMSAGEHQVPHGEHLVPGDCDPVLIGGS